ncbi:MAG: phenylalanine 4-monooxygenase [Pseudopedobacter saltans]|uniref:Phenylalanine 4-monooxygenase n=1 Tax=Pseudopedobacter saltans TaxID=151895 RepID=A0A2W5F677_9SPHI|nr:MAG: phenylalanine 4-monooxygenase [Pseudopedobacter saltans]
MYKLHLKIKRAILSFLDFFYPIFRRFLPLQTYRYAACGGFNLGLSLVLYPLIYNFIFRQQLVHIGDITISAPIATLCLNVLITTPVGFYLSMFVVFQGSELPKKIQLFRYILVVIGCAILNYVLLKLFVEVFHWWSTPSYYLNVVLVTSFSYFAQRYFSFKKKKQ